MPVPQIAEEIMRPEWCGCSWCHKKTKWTVDLASLDEFVSRHQDNDEREMLSAALWQLRNARALLRHAAHELDSPATGYDAGTTADYKRWFHRVEEFVQVVDGEKTMCFACGQAVRDGHTCAALDAEPGKGGTDE